jgi:hypothetical protein
MQYLEDHKSYSDAILLQDQKEKYLLEHYDERTKIYLEECKQEIKTITEENLCLSIHFFWNYLSILDLMLQKSIEEINKLHKKDRLIAF